MVGDWLIRTQTVAWLRLAKADRAAKRLAQMPEIASQALAATAMSAAKEAERAAVNQRDAVWSTPRQAASAKDRDAFDGKAWKSPWSANGDMIAGLAAVESKTATASTALDAARAAVWVVPTLRPYADLWNDAYEASHMAANAAIALHSRTKLLSVKNMLQKSAVKLIRRLAATEA
jgi:hypothetical protein